MQLPVIQGVIRRRLLVNFRVDPGVMGRALPAPFRPKLQAGHAIAGICLIRLEQIRPAGLPGVLGIASENAAHRVAVLWDGPGGETHEGVYIPRRDTSSMLNHLAGGRVFPGEHHLSAFEVEDEGGRVVMDIRAKDGQMSVRIQAHEAEALPASSCFSSLEESSAFFEKGSVGYSATSEPGRLDGIELRTDGWVVRPLAVEHVESSYFSDPSRFPPGTVAFDHALLMRDVLHQWHAAPDMLCAAVGQEAATTAPG